MVLIRVSTWHTQPGNCFWLCRTPLRLAFGDAVAKAKISHNENGHVFIAALERHVRLSLCLSLSLSLSLSISLSLSLAYSLSISISLPLALPGGPSFSLPLGPSRILYPSSLVLRPSLRVTRKERREARNLLVALTGVPRKQPPHINIQKVYA